jgi:hypothetical protein
MKKICLLTLLLLSGQFCTTIAADATQTCRTYDLPLSAPTARYQVNADGTVQDNTTGLLWKRCSEGQSGVACDNGTAVTYSWQDALSMAADTDFAGVKGWRLPTITELATLLEYQCTMPAINLRVFPATPAANFWSATPYAGYANGAWNLNFNDGVHDNSSKNYRLYIRLVRGSGVQGVGR